MDDPFQLPMVRMRPEVSAQPDINVCKIKVRIDFYPHAGELDYSFIAWHHPMGVLLRNETWSHYDKEHVGMASADLVAQLFDTIKAFPEPF